METQRKPSRRPVAAFGECLRKVVPEGMDRGQKVPKDTAQPADGGKEMGDFGDTQSIKRSSGDGVGDLE